LDTLFKYNLVDNIFGADSTVAKIIYVLVVMSAVWGLITLLRNASRSESADRRAERMERESGHEREREDMRTHPAERVDRAGYGTTGRREDRRTSNRSRR
jgi:hypothetical protein